MRGLLKSILTYSNIMATIAVFIALGAGAYAATTFVTRQGAIRGCVTKGGQITLVKSGGTCPKGRQTISWNQRGVPGQSGSNGAGGAPGATGTPGAKGSQGERGPSDGYVASLAEGTGSATVSVAVPAGDYIAQGGCIASQVNGTKNGSAEADLTADNDPNHLDTQVSTVPFTGRAIFASKFGRATLSTHTGFHLPNGGTISEKCGDESGSEVTGMSYNNLQVIAERVGTLHG
jgi:hypothetical protein